MTENMRSWIDEEKKLNEGGTFFKMVKETPYEVTFLDEGGPEYKKTFDGKEKTRVNFRVKVSGGSYQNSEMVWSVSKVEGKRSVWGMLTTLFVKAKQSTGVVIHIRATGDLRDRKYDIKEYNDHLFGK
jgi:hypothetical protein